MVSDTDPSTKKPITPWRARKASPSSGLKAISTPGWLGMCMRPRVAMAMNHRRQIGPNRVATLAVPRDWTRNSPINTARAMAISTAGVITGARPGDGLQPLHRREHRYRRGDDGVAIEEGGADHAQGEHRRRAAADRALGERHQGEDPALALVVGPHDEGDVLDRDHDDQRPQGQGHDAQDLGRAPPDRARPG